MLVGAIIHGQELANMYSGQPFRSFTKYLVGDTHQKPEQVSFEASSEQIW